MRQTSGAALFRSFSDTIARAFRWSRPSTPRVLRPAEATARGARESDSKVIRVLSAPRPWLSEFTWDKVLNFNHEQCQLQNTQSLPNTKSYDAVRQLWGARHGQPVSLVKALDFCKECHDQTPFVFSSSSTFCGLARAMVEELAKDLPPVEAHILRTTTANYVSGRVNKRELIGILRVYESKWSALAQARAHAAGNGHAEKPSVGPV